MSGRRQLAPRRGSPALVLALLLALVPFGGTPAAAAQGAPSCAPGQAPRFVFGFAALREQLGDVMGEPVTCEFPDPNGTGDVHQRTSTGLAFWRKATNIPTFTNGWDHWGWTDDGLEYWTGESIDPPGREVPPPAPPATPPCETLPVRGFGTVFAARPEAFELLGCPAYPPQEQAIDTLLQRFERGWMLRVAATAPYQRPQIYVLFEDEQRFVRFDDTWNPAGDPESTGLTPPPGRLEPVRGFGKVWREGTGARVRERLGWAVELERAGRGAYQNFQRGRMEWTPEPRLIFVLADWTSTQPRELLQAWRVYPDTFEG